jgi:hypothetical protein
VSPLTDWQAYQCDVAGVAGDLLAAVVTGRRGSVQVQESVDVAGRNGSHQVDVLVTDGNNALFIECKNHNRVLTKDAVSATLYNFLDVCSGNRGFRWSLAIVSATDIPEKARLPAMRPDGIYVPAENLAGRSLADSCHFFYFKPPRNPELAVPLYLTSGRAGSLVAAGAPDAEPDVLETCAHDATVALPTRIAAGLRLIAQRPNTLWDDRELTETILHGLMHMGLVQEAFYLQRMQLTRGVGGRGQTRSGRIDELMMQFLLTRRRYAHNSKAGWRSLEALGQMIAEASTLQRLAIETFVGPVLARHGDEAGFAMLADVELLVPRLDAEYASYYELLRLVRIGQVVGGTRRDELFQRAHSLVSDLPVWNRYFSSALLAAAACDAGSLHGIDTPFDATEWC